MKYCSRCGKEANDDAVICLGCGCAFDVMPVAVAPAVKVEAEPEKKKGSFGSAISIVAFVLALVSIGAPIVATPIAWIIGDWINVLVCIVTFIVSIITLSLSVKAKNMNKSDVIAVLGLISSVASILISLIVGLASVVGFIVDGLLLIGLFLFWFFLPAILVIGVILIALFIYFLPYILYIVVYILAFMVVFASLIFGF